MSPTGAVFEMQKLGSVGRNGAARILVIRMRRIGDILLHTPTLRAIRTALPAATIDMLVLEGFDVALRGNPNLDRLIVLGRSPVAFLRALAACARADYDTVLDFQSSARSLPFVVASRAPIRVGWRKRVARNWAYTRLVPRQSVPDYGARDVARLAEAIGVQRTGDVHLDITVQPQDRAATAAAFAAAGVDVRRPVIACSVVSVADRKRWSVERYALLADRMIDEFGAQLVFTSGPGEIDQVGAVVERMRHRPVLWQCASSSLSGMASIYERCHLWVGNDGGPKHVATAAGCPTVMITAAGEERLWSDAHDPRQCAVWNDGASPTERLPAAVGVERVFAAVMAMVDRLRRDGGFPAEVPVPPSGARLADG